jgi:uncharacterized protein
MKQQTLSKLLTFALSAAVLVRSGAAQTATGEVKLGRSYAFQAEGITGDIPVSVHLPAASAKGDAKFPVLYLLDLGDDFAFGSAVTDFLAAAGRIPSLVVVEVNLDAVQGGLPAMAAFLEKILFPWVEKNCRGEARRVIYGHSGRSFATLFLLLSRPDLCEAAICPGFGLTWPVEKGRMDFSALAEKTFAGAASFPKALVFSLGDEKKFVPGVERFIEVLKARAPKDFRWTYLSMPDDDHASTKLKTLYLGLEFVFRGKVSTMKL